ncbi:hypothetical protein ABFS82_12G084200 [Erythranthe guttata]
MEKPSIVSIFVFVLLFLHCGIPMLMSAEASILECLKDQDCSYLSCANPKCICQCNKAKPAIDAAAKHSVEPTDIPPCRFAVCRIPSCQNPHCGCLC